MIIYFKHRVSECGNIRPLRKKQEEISFIRNEIQAIIYHDH